MSNITEKIRSYSTFSEGEIIALLTVLLEKKKKQKSAKSIYKTLLSCIDLTSLQNTDTEETITCLTEKINRFGENYPELPNIAGLCVYPVFVKNIKETLTENVEIVSVAGGFPHSQTYIEVKIAETALAVLDGASEIDVTIPTGKLKEEKYEEIYEELQEIKLACRAAKLKVILESGSLTYNEIQKAAIVAMEAGADFIKTSTGKQGTGATTAAAYIMCKTIHEYFEKTGRKVGFKAAGGIRDTESAIDYYYIVEAVLGKDWLEKDLFRIGASSLANNLVSSILEKEIHCF